MSTGIWVMIIMFGAFFMVTIIPEVIQYLLIRFEKGKRKTHSQALSELSEINNRYELH